MYNTLKFFDFNFFEKLLDSLGTLLQSAWDIVLIAIAFIFVLGVVMIPVLLLYVIALFIIKRILKKEIDFFKYYRFVIMVGVIATALLFSFA